MAIVGLIVTAVIMPPVGQFFINVVDDWGWLRNAAAKVAAVIEWFSWIVATSWFHWGGGIILGFTAGMWTEFWLRRKEIAPLIQKTHVDLNGLADRAEFLANNINGIVGDLQPRPPVHPIFYMPDGKHATHLWQQDMIERQEKAQREFFSKYHASVISVLETAKEYIQITDSEFWMARQITGIHSISSAAALMAQVSARLKRIEGVDSI